MVGFYSYLYTFTMPLGIPCWLSKSRQIRQCFACVDRR